MSTVFHQILVKKNSTKLVGFVNHWLLVQ